MVTKDLKTDPPLLELLVIGSFSSSVLPGAYEAAQSSTDWILVKDVSQYLTSCQHEGQIILFQTIFMNNMNKNFVYLFPLKYCGQL